MLKEGSRPPFLVFFLVVGCKVFDGVVLIEWVYRPFLVTGGRARQRVLREGGPLPFLLFSQAVSYKAFDRVGVLLSLFGEGRGVLSLFGDPFW